MGTFISSYTSDTTTRQHRCRWPVMSMYKCHSRVFT